MGFQDRGLLKDRWCVPIHDNNGEQLGYTGRHVGKGKPKWLFPAGFPKDQVLFNLHRLIEPESGQAISAGVVIVEGVGDCIRLHMRDIPAVAVLGTHVNKDHVAMLEAVGFTQALLLFDGDEQGRKAAEKSIATLATKLFARDVQLPDDDDPETVSVEFLEQHLWWL